ncbi:MAG: peptidase S8 [Candidatus Eremiobacteraeota bacterium]|nr:peptidase S8 [Candidatus Eremiobacteraeota bacterium]
MLLRYSRYVSVALLASLVSACAGGSGAPTATIPNGNGASTSSLGTAKSVSTYDGLNTRENCGAVGAGRARCFSVVRTDIAPQIDSPDITVAGYGPADLSSAYNLPKTGGFQQTVGIVDAYDDPNAEADLAVYRSHFGIPACSTANGCFKKVSQTGTTQYPSPDPGWAAEMSLDLDMVSAVCPKCHIILVEATSNSFSDLGKSVDEAVKLGADEVSNSYGGGEFAASSPDFSHPHIIITASSGDSGYGATQPCSFATVVCVGGTTLTKSNTQRGWNETAWPGAGSGCSALVAKPSWQTDKGCTMRSEADTSAVADPSTGVAVYDTYQESGWLVFGGTSVASPVLASMYGLARNAKSLEKARRLWLNLGSSNLNDVTLGSNGNCPQKIYYICHAGPGYDGPTGVGTPNGLGAL